MPWTPRSRGAAAGLNSEDAMASAACVPATLACGGKSDGPSLGGTAPSPACPAAVRGVAGAASVACGGNRLRLSTAAAAAAAAPAVLVAAPFLDACAAVRSSEGRPRAPAWRGRLRGMVTMPARSSRHLTLWICSICTQPAHQLRRPPTPARPTVAR